MKFSLSIFFILIIALAAGAKAKGFGKFGTLDQGNISYRTTRVKSSIKTEFTFKEPVEKAESSILTTIFMAKSCKRRFYSLDSSTFDSAPSEVKRGTVKYHCTETEKNLVAGGSQHEYLKLICDEPEAQKKYLFDLCNKN